MRDTGPRHPGLVVVVDRVAVIGLEQTEVDLAEPVGRDRLPFLDEPVRLQFVVRKQHLRIERADDAVDGVLEEHDALAFALGAGQHELEKQRLAQRGRHLGDEDRVVRIDERLVRVRQQRVHRVAGFVGQREHRVKRVVVIQEHVRVDAVDGRRVRPAALARILVNVNPSAVEGLAQLLLVVAAERRD